MVVPVVEREIGTDVVHVAVVDVWFSDFVICQCGIGSFYQHVGGLFVV